MVKYFQRGTKGIVVKLTELSVEAREQFEGELSRSKDLKATANLFAVTVTEHSGKDVGVLEPSLYSGLPKQVVEIRYVDF